MKTAKVICLILLFINGIGAIYGSIPLIKDPSGASLGFYTSWLSKPFVSYFIPGIVLLVVNGIGSLLVALVTLLDKDHYPVLIILQGSLLIIWILVQLAFFSETSLFQPAMLLLGSLLIWLGYFIHNKRKVL